MVDGCLAVIFFPSLPLSYCVNRRSDQIYTRKVRLNVSLFSWNGAGKGGRGECLNETFIYVVQIAWRCCVGRCVVLLLFLWLLAVFLAGQSLGCLYKTSAM